MSNAQHNPYSSPQVPQDRQAAAAFTAFYVLYAACFALAVVLWFTSDWVRRFDLLELPMVAMLFPLAMFIDPHDGFVNHPEWAVPGGALCWLAVIPIARRAATTRRRLLTALGILAGVAMLSTLFALFVV